MRKEAANEAIAVPFEGCIKHAEYQIFPPDSICGLLTSFYPMMGRAMGGELLLVRSMGLGPDISPICQGLSCCTLKDVFSLQKSQENGENQQSPNL